MKRRLVSVVLPVLAPGGAGGPMQQAGRLVFRPRNRP